MTTEDGRTTGIDLFWLPLGAGGHFVRFNGRVYEAIKSRLEHRRSLNLFHTALEVTVPEGRYVVENAWPIPDSEGGGRGVVVEGPVGSPRLGRFRVFRYEIRRWHEGSIADVMWAAGGPQRISEDPERAYRILDLAPEVPPLVWGRDELALGEMWNSNSVVSWLLTRSGLPVDEILPPAGGRAPGWGAGIQVAHMAARD